MNRFNTGTFKLQNIQINLQNLEELSLTRELNPVNYQVVNFDHKIAEKEKPYFINVLTAAMSPLSGDVHSVHTHSIVEEIRKLMANASGGWEIQCCGHVLGWAIPTTRCLNSDGDPNIICYWEEKVRYSLLLCWGWHDLFFLGGDDWGHEECSYRLDNLSYDELLVIEAALEAGIIDTNYWNAFHQIKDGLETGILKPFWYFEEDEEDFDVTMRLYFEEEE